MNEVVNKTLETLKKGDIVAGRYEIIEKIGEGAMGVVFTCRHINLGDRVLAIKILKPEIAEDKKIVERFRNEVNAAYDVSHKNIVRAYEFIKEGDLVAYTMEYVEGGDLMDLIEGLNLISIKDVIRYMYGICIGAQALHDQGIIHRDLKPENILLSKKGDLKISDFGISIIERTTRITEHGGLVGSANYLAPEYMIDGIVDNRIDIYAIGIISYELLTGKDPYEADTVYTMMQKKVETDPEYPVNHRPDCPDKLARIILKCMHKDPSKRYQSCNDIIADLANLSDFPQELLPQLSRSIYTKEDLVVSKDKKNPSKDEELLMDLDFEIEGNKESQTQKPSEIIPEQNKEYETQKTINQQPTEKTKIHSVSINEGKVKKSNIKKYLILSLPIIVIILGYMIVANSKNEFEVLPNELVKEVAKNQILEDEALQVLEEDIQNITTSIPSIVMLKKNIEGMEIEAVLNFSENKLIGISADISFPFSEENKKLQLKSMNLNHIAIGYQEDNTYSSLLDVDVVYYENNIEYKSKVTGLAKGQINTKTGEVTLDFLVPEKFNIEKAKRNFYITNYQNKIIFYAFGSLDNK